MPMSIPTDMPPLPPEGFSLPPGSVQPFSLETSVVVDTLDDCGQQAEQTFATWQPKPEREELLPRTNDGKSMPATVVQEVHSRLQASSASMAEMFKEELAQQEMRLAKQLQAMECKLLDAFKRSGSEMLVRRVTAAAHRFEPMDGGKGMCREGSDRSTTRASAAWKQSLDAKGSAETVTKGSSQGGGSADALKPTRASVGAQLQMRLLNLRWSRPSRDSDRETQLGLKKHSVGAMMYPPPSRLQRIRESSASHDAPTGYRKYLLRCHTTAARITADRRFDWLVAAVILANAVVIGINVDWAIQHIGSERPGFHRVLNLFFTFFFIFELVIRMFAELQDFIYPYSINFTWNVFDSMMVLMAVSEEVTSMISGEGKSNISALRLLRILRLTRVVRFVRVMRFFRDLRVMVNGILGSMKALLWCIILLVLVMYMFAVLVLQVVTVELEDIDALLDDSTARAADVDYAENSRNILEGYFGNMGLCLYTLYKCIMGGVDWGEPAERLRLIHPAWVGPFLGYICFGMLCVLNVVTGVFVENANKITSQDQDHMISEEMTARQAYLNQLRTLFEHADTDKSGEIDLEEFRALTSQPHVQFVFRKIGLEVESVSMTKLFGLFDPDGIGKIDIDEFIVGVQRLKGHARALDIVKLLHQSRDLKRRVGGLEALCMANFQQQLEVEERMCKALGVEPPEITPMTPDFPIGHSSSIGERMTSKVSAQRETTV